MTKPKRKAKNPQLRFSKYNWELICYCLKRTRDSGVWPFRESEMGWLELEIERRTKRK